MPINDYSKAWFSAKESYSKGEKRRKKNYFQNKIIALFSHSVSFWNLTFTLTLKLWNCRWAINEWFTEKCDLSWKRHLSLLLLLLLFYFSNLFFFLLSIIWKKGRSYNISTILYIISISFISCRMEILSHIVKGIISHIITM